MERLLESKYNDFKCDYEYNIVENRNIDSIFFRTGSDKHLPIIEIDKTSAVTWYKKYNKFCVKIKKLEYYDEINKIINNFIESNPSYIYVNDYDNKLLISTPSDKKFRIFKNILNENIYCGAKSFNELMESEIWNLNNSKIYLKVEFVIRILKSRKEIRLSTICYQICYTKE